MIYRFIGFLLPEETHLPDLLDSVQVTHAACLELHRHQVRLKVQGRYTGHQLLSRLWTWLAVTVFSCRQEVQPVLRQKRNRSSVKSVDHSLVWVGFRPTPLSVYVFRNIAIPEITAFRNFDRRLRASHISTHNINLSLPKL